MIEDILGFFKQCREMGVHVELHFSSSDQSWSDASDVPGTPPALGKEKERPKEEDAGQESPRTRTRRPRGSDPKASSTEQKPKTQTKEANEEEVREDVRTLMRKVIADKGNDEAFRILADVTKKKKLPEVDLDGLLKLKEYLEATPPRVDGSDEGGML